MLQLIKFAYVFTFAHPYPSFRPPPSSMSFWAHCQIAKEICGIPRKPVIQVCLNRFLCKIVVSSIFTKCSTCHNNCMVCFATTVYVWEYINTCMRETLFDFLQLPPPGGNVFISICLFICLSVYLSVLHSKALIELILYLRFPSPLCKSSYGMVTALIMSFLLFNRSLSTQV